MDFFLSKPIRRPALKHVLKTYCAPIPEEEGEATTPPATEASTSRRSNGRVVQPQPATSSGMNTVVPVTVIAGISDRDASPAISPLTRPDGRPDL